MPACASSHPRCWVEDLRSFITPTSHGKTKKANKQVQQAQTPCLSTRPGTARQNDSSQKEKRKRDYKGLLNVQQTGIKVHVPVISYRNSDVCSREI